MTFISLSDSLFTDALNSLETALVSGQLDKEHVKGIIDQKKAMWRDLEKKHAKLWIAMGIKHAQDHSISKTDVNMNDIDVLINPYTD